VGYEPEVGLPAASPYLDALASLAGRALTTTDVTAVFRDAAQLVSGVLGCRFAEVLEVRSDGHHYVPRAAVGWPADLLGAALPCHGAHAGRGWAASAIVTDGGQAPGSPAWGLLRELGARGGVSVVLSAGGHPFGLLGAHTAGARSFDAAQVAFLRTVAALVSLAIDRTPTTTKLEAVGELAGGLAHDFNNLLTVVLGYVEVMLDEVADGSPLRADLEGINRAAERAVGLVQQLLAFGRRQVMQPVVFDLNRALASLEGRLHHVVGEDVLLQVQPSREPVLIEADPSQVEQVVVNLAMNARDAMPHGGTITIATAADSEVARFVPDGPGHVTLTVADTGAGMDGDTLARCFEPFFTTKDPARRPGLGLATVFGILRQSNGDVWAESTPGAGTVVTARFPLVGRYDAEEPRAAPPDVVRQSTATILLVEDEHEVRGLARQALTGAGYRVLEASNGRDALELAEGHDGVIDVLLADVVMPEVGGVELAGRLFTDGRVQRVLFISGYPDGAGEVDNGAIDGDRLLAKPFRAEDLLGRVRQVLEGVGGA
jgi:signal transduction histidine kinase/ActR/RegA family two-component response regulator